MRFLSRKEVLAVFASSLAAGFVLSFRSWGDPVDVSVGLQNLLFAIIISFLIIFLRVFLQKFYAERMAGYSAVYSVHRWGLPASIFLAFFTNGFLPYVAPGALTLRVSRNRAGSFRRGPNFDEVSLVAVFGVLASVIVVVLVRPFLVAGYSWASSVTFYAAAIGFFGLIPIPGSEAFVLFYHSRSLWVFVISFTLFYFLLVLYGGLISFLIATVLASVITYFYVKYVEKN